MELIKLITYRPALETFNKYENGQIYAIICKTTNKIYIGLNVKKSMFINILKSLPSVSIIRQKSI